MTLEDADIDVKATRVIEAHNARLAAAGEATIKNPRNGCAGMMKRKEPEGIAAAAPPHVRPRTVSGLLRAATRETSLRLQRSAAGTTRPGGCGLSCGTAPGRDRCHEHGS